MLCWAFVSVRGLSLVVASGGHTSLRCAGLSLSWPLLWRSTSSRCAGSVVVAHGPSCSAACGILPYQSSNLCPLHWQADSQPLHHQGSPELFNFDEVQFIYFFFCCFSFYEQCIYFFFCCFSFYEQCIYFFFCYLCYLFVSYLGNHCLIQVHKDLCLCFLKEFYSFSSYIWVYDPF